MLHIYLEKVAIRNKNILNLEQIQVSVAETASFPLIFILRFLHRNKTFQFFMDHRLPFLWLAVAIGLSSEQ